MLPAYKGRINRKTFVIGNIVGLSLLGFAALIYIVPIAVIDIVVNGTKHAAPVFKLLYSLFLIPFIFYFFFFTVLFVKRMHDIGFPGLLILWVFIIAEGLARVVDIWELNVLGLLIVLGVCFLPGQKIRNNFGPQPGKKFKMNNLVIKF
jgi:uncharacterized membrane protein YhaH (DUF805 family)